MKVGNDVPLMCDSKVLVQEGKGWGTVVLCTLYLHWATEWNSS